MSIMMSSENLMGSFATESKRRRTKRRHMRVSNSGDTRFVSLIGDQWKDRRRLRKKKLCLPITNNKVSIIFFVEEIVYVQSLDKGFTKRRPKFSW